MPVRAGDDERVQSGLRSDYGGREALALVTYTVTIKLYPCYTFQDRFCALGLLLDLQRDEQLHSHGYARVRLTPEPARPRPRPSRHSGCVGRARRGDCLH